MLIFKNEIFIFTVPYVVNPKTQPKYDNDRNTYGHRSTVVIIVPTTTTTRRPILVTPNNIDRNDHSNSQSVLVSSKNRKDGFASVAAAAAAAAAADAPAAITPTQAYSNRNIQQSNVNSIFIPASTSKYPIKQSTISEDFRERFDNFVEHWKKAFVYLSRKWKLKLRAMS